MGQNSKTPKGDISIQNTSGRIRLRWRYRGERYSFSLPYAYNEENLSFAKVKAAEIKLDILKGTLDTSLEKYREKKHNSLEDGSFVEKKPPIFTSRENAKKHSYILDKLVDYFNDWGTNIRNVQVDQSIDYLYTRRLLEKWVNVPVDAIPGKLNAENWAATTYNRRLGYLSNFFSWLLEKGVIERNPLNGVKRKREKGKKKNPRRKPLTEVEIHQLLEAIKKDTFCPNSSRYKHSHYYPFLYFMFLTGVRNAEAIGLRVRHISFDKKHIEISEAFARTVKGSNHAARISKGTKMENVRYLPLNSRLEELLKDQVTGKQSDDFVFPSPKGLSIDDRMLEKRILKPVMKELGLGDRDLYVARHSFGTRAAQQNMPMTEIAYLMGHSTIETAIRNYISVNRSAPTLPKI